MRKGLDDQRSDELMGQRSVCFVIGNSILQLLLKGKKEALGLLLCLELFWMGVRKSGDGDNRNKLGPGIDGKSKEY